MRARHTAHSTPTFPVYSAAFLSPTELVLGGGGGASKTGIKNKLVRHRHLSSLTPIPHCLLLLLSETLPC
jgi:prolactin regulatory element-binding protein